MRLCIPILCLAALRVATANPLPYDDLNTNVDNLELDTGYDISDNNYAPETADPSAQPPQPQAITIAQGQGEDGDDQTNSQPAPKIFCNSGYVRACCSYKAGRLDSAGSGLHHFQCFSIPTDTEECDSEYGLNYSPTNKVMEKGGDLCCRDDPGVRSSSTGDFICQRPQPAQENVRPVQPGGNGGNSDAGTIRVVPFGQ